MPPVFSVWGHADTQRASIGSFRFDYCAVCCFSLFLCPLLRRPRAPVTVCISVSPKLWACTFRWTPQTGKNEACSPSVGLGALSEADLRLHFWKMNLWEIDHFPLKNQLKILWGLSVAGKHCVDFFPPQIAQISALPMKMTASKIKWCLEQWN